MRTLGEQRARFYLLELMQLWGATGSSDRQRGRRLRLKLTERTHISISSCVFSTLCILGSRSSVSVVCVKNFFSPSQPSWRVPRATCFRSAHMKRSDCGNKRKQLSEQCQDCSLKLCTASLTQPQPTIGNRRKGEKKRGEKTYGTLNTRKGRKILRRWQPCCAKPPRARRNSTTKPFHHHRQKTSPPPLRITHRQNITGARTTTQIMWRVFINVPQWSRRKVHTSQSQLLFHALWQACHEKRMYCKRWSHYVAHYAFWSLTGFVSGGMNSWSKSLRLFFGGQRCYTFRYILGKWLREWATNEQPTWHTKKCGPIRMYQ